MKAVRLAWVLAATVLYLFPAASGFAQSGEEVPSIKVGHVGHDHQLALYVAADAGMELQALYGVRLQTVKEQEVYDLFDSGKKVARVFLSRVGGGSKMPAALEQGHIEVGLGGLGPTAKFIDKGSPLKVLLPLNNDGDFLVLGNKMEASNWEEFAEHVKKSDKPVRIGYKSPMAVAYMILTSALMHEGISYGAEPLDENGKPVKVITVNLQGLSNALPSLEAGIVEGVVVNEPMASILVHKGAGRIVSDLSSLPPKGKWEGHPCCVVAATMDAIREKRSIIVSLLRVIAAGSDLIGTDSKRALRSEGLWTRTAPEVGQNSIKNVDYVFMPDKDWLSAVSTWIELMADSGRFSGKFKGKSAGQVREAVVETGPAMEALKDMKFKSQKE